jgi:hypothetical protein
MQLLGLYVFEPNFARLIKITHEKLSTKRKMRFRFVRPTLFFSALLFTQGAFKILTYHICSCFIDKYWLTRIPSNTSTKEFPWRYSAASAYSWQLCSPSCVKCQSQDGSPKFHPLPSESSWLVPGTLHPHVYVGTFFFHGLTARCWA